MTQATKEDDLVRGITNGEIDMGVALFEIDLDRNEMLSFSFPIVRFGWVALLYYMHFKKAFDWSIPRFLKMHRVAV